MAGFPVHPDDGTPTLRGSPPQQGPHPAPSWTALRWLIILVFGLTGARAPGAESAGSKPPSGDFFTAGPDGENTLPTDRMHPRGRLFPFWGYSGSFTREKESGFTIGGPHYGGHENQLAARQQSLKAGLPYLFHIGLPGTFVAGTLTAAPDTWADAVARQVRSALVEDGVAAWVIHPEELRMWRAHEREYLRVVTETIRAHDPEQRPIFMYEPNNRTADSMVQSARHLDVVTRGAYVQATGFQNERAWVRWVMGQQVEAARRLREQDGQHRPCWLIAQLSQDPEDPADDAHIPAWVRHDVYAALISGARGVGIWSLWPRRASVRRTYELWYGAYAQVARELTGAQNLGQVFLFGEKKTDIGIRQISGPPNVTLWTGPRNEMESETTHDAERAKHRHILPSAASLELAWRGRRYVFICNSSPEPIELELSGWPAQGCMIEDAFTGNPVPFRPSLRWTLEPWGVKAWSFRSDAQP